MSCDSPIATTESELRCSFFGFFLFGFTVGCLFVLFAVYVLWLTVPMIK